MKEIRSRIIELEKAMRKKPKATTVLELAETYVEAGQPHQAVAVLLEGIETFPEHLELHYLCARFIVMYQPEETPNAEKLIKGILKKDPNNTAARQLLEQIMTCVDTMHEVALPYGSDLSNLPTIKSVKVNKATQPSESGDEKQDSDLFPKYHQELKKGFGLLDSNKYDEAISVFGAILEEDPENSDAREGFRLAYAGMVKTRESVKKHKRIEVVGRTIQFLDAMQKVSQMRHNKGSETS